MNTVYEIMIRGDATTSQVAAKVAQCRRNDPHRTVVVRAENPDWQQARAAFTAGASDYLPQGQEPVQADVMR